MAEGTQGPSSQNKEQYWGGHIDAWRNSGLSQAEYSRRAQVSAQALSYWKQKFAEEPVDPAEDIPTIVALPVNVMAGAPAGEVQPLLVHLPNGLRVEIGGDFQSAVLEKLVRTLARLC